MSVKGQLYQDLILDHFKNPRNRRDVVDAELKVEEHNPSCGDVVRLAFSEDEGMLKDLHYGVCGCAISVASSSILSEQLKDTSVVEARQLVGAVLAAFEAEGGAFDDDDLSALLTVKNFPMRLKCATLPWVAMKRVL